MARKKSSMIMNASLEVETGGPLDAREVVDNLSDLTDPASFPYFYVGIAVYVKSEETAYALVGDDPTVLENWQKIWVDYTAGQGIRIDGKTIDTPLLDNDYLKEVAQVEKTTQVWQADWSQASSDYALGSHSKRIALSSRMPSNVRIIVPYLGIDAVAVDWSWSQQDGSYTNWAPKDANGNWILGDSGKISEFHDTYGFTDQWNYDLFGSDSFTDVSWRIEVGQHVDQKVIEPEEVHVRQLSGIVKEDYSDEWFSDLTEQQINDIFANVYGEGADINEQFEAGVSIPFGTWKENGVVYDLCRKVLIYDGTLPTNGVIEFSLGETDVSFITRLSGTALASDGSYVISAPAQDNSLGYVPASGNIRFSTLANYSLYKKLRIVVEYARARG